MTTTLAVRGIDAKNLDLGFGGWYTVHGTDSPRNLPKRPPLSKLGTAIKVGLNSFNVTSFPAKDVYQFQVLINGEVPEKRALMNKVWNSAAAKKALGSGWIWDGNLLAWNLRPMEREMRVLVDLDAESNRKPRADGKSNEHRLVVRQTNKISFTQLEAYINGQSSFDGTCLEAMNFLDHLLRHWPSENLVQIKRSFFNPADFAERKPLGNGVEVAGGVYQSMRVVHGGATGRLAINVDVQNAAFYAAMPLTDAATLFLDKRDTNDIMASIKKETRGGSVRPENTPVARQLAKMRRLRVESTHRKKTPADRYVIDSFIWTTAQELTFERQGKSISLYDYFEQAYGYRLKYKQLPLVKMTKGKNTVLPMELLRVIPNQRYPFKLREKQTSEMLKFAVTLPAQRWASIERGLKMLNWTGDPVHKHFGLQVSTQRTVADARLLPAPKVQFGGGGEAKPGVSGKWDLRGKKFIEPGTHLKSWGICAFGGYRGGRIDKAIIDKFVADFTRAYAGHGGTVVNKNPPLYLAGHDSPSEWVSNIWSLAGKQANARPQLLVFIVSDRDSDTYNWIKRSCDCRFGVASQVMQYSQVVKGNPQYYSNVLMKVNAKLHGSTARAVGQKTGGGAPKVPTMIIGADVTHASPGSVSSSIAAMTMSMDRSSVKYAAFCEKNGARVELITNIKLMLREPFRNWVNSKTAGAGKLPSNIIYFRDGVGESQYHQVLEQEIKVLRQMIDEEWPSMSHAVKFVVVVGTKRHHVRFFPEAGKGDRNGNPHPGTLVETGVTNPFEHDFYLCSHSAIKGTARPMHYHVILNEANMANEDLQTMIYEHSYQYVRSTTPVSMHPALYYAHIAANRAIPHDPLWGNKIPPIGAAMQAKLNRAREIRDKEIEADQSKGALYPRDARPGEDPDVVGSFDTSYLHPVEAAGNLPAAMWYI